MFHFDLQIKRPYFHVKPLDHLQLQAWHSYLDWELAELNKDARQSSPGDEATVPVHQSQSQLFWNSLAFYLPQKNQRQRLSVTPESLWIDVIFLD